MFGSAVSGNVSGITAAEGKNKANTLIETKDGYSVFLLFLKEKSFLSALDGIEKCCRKIYFESYQLSLSDAGAFAGLENFLRFIKN